MFLYDLNKGDICRINSLPEIPLLHSLGLRQNLVINIKSFQPFGGPIVIQVGRRNIAISKDIAKTILVEKTLKNTSKQAV